MANLYDDYRSKITSGDLLVWTTKKKESISDWILYLIQSLTRSSFVHTGTAWVVADRVFVVEALVPKVVVTELSSKLSFYHLYIPQPWLPEYEPILLENVGKKYGFMNIVKMYLGIGKTDPDEWFCSQMTANYYTRTGYITNDDVGFTPGSVVECLMSKSGSGLVKVITKAGE